MDKPVIKRDPLYQLLRTEDIKGFNEQREQLDTSELQSGDYRGRDLRNMNAREAWISATPIFATPTSAVSIFAIPTWRAPACWMPSYRAPISPQSSAPQEIRLSLDTGTRLRYEKDENP